MEDALRVLRDFSMKVIRICLNPCSNGRCSARRLNPDCLEKLLKVLILVLMEDALRGPHRDYLCGHKGVLILVLMEDALRVTWRVLSRREVPRLNPCSNGRCSARSGRVG